jgi:hypothetical protein
VDVLDQLSKDVRLELLDDQRLVLVVRRLTKKKQMILKLFFTFFAF